MSEAALDLVETAPLLPRMWELRADLTGYDASYVAVAEAVQAALVTCDARLTRAPGLACEIRLGLLPA